MLYLYIGLGAFFFLGISIAGSASANFLDAVNKKGLIRSSLAMTTANFANQVVKNRNLPVHVITTPGKLGDFYSSRNKVIALSEDFYQSDALVGIVIAAHEFGHAITDYERSSIFHLHRALSRICRFLNSIFYLVLITSIVCLLAIENNIYFEILIFTAVGIVGLSTLLKLITVKNEKNASKIGIELLRENGADKRDIKAAKKIYNAALITYIGAIFMPIVKILQFIIYIIYITIGKIFS